MPKVVAPSKTASFGIVKKSSSPLRPRAAASVAPRPGSLIRVSPFRTDSRMMNRASSGRLCGSLFPGHEWGVAPGSPDTLAVFNAPKPPPERISLSATRLSRTREALFLVSGESKHWAVSEWRAGKDIPAASIRPIAGVDVLVESALLAPIHDPARRM